jgi:hypothetical protein
MTPEERAARERKQKIFVVVGGLFLVAMLAFQLPKLLGGSSEAAATTTTEGQISAPITAARSVASAANGVVTPAGGSASIVRTAKLSSFNVFRPKDPFVQQVKTGPPVTGSPAAGAPAKGAGAKGGEKPTKFSTGGAAKVQSATIVVVNGIRQVLEPGMKFPSSDPLFVLVAEKPGSKSVVVGIAGGAYSGGGKTTTLKVGKPLTLVNTATGARYKISLVSVGSGDRAGPSATDATETGK